MKRIIRIMMRVYAMCMIIWISGLYVYYWDHTPEIIKIETGSTQEFSLAIPASGKLIDTGYQEKVAEVFLMQPITMTAGSMQANYEVNLKLYGIIPFKRVSIQVVDELKLWPVGELYGFYLETKGVLVIGIGDFMDYYGERVSPAKECLKEGDYLLKINGEEIHSKKQFQEMIENSEGQELWIDGERNGEYFHTQVVPVKYQDGSYKLGIWIRDNAQGVGTVTYVDENGKFGALGHPITDSDTNQVLEIEDGRLYDAQVLSIQ